MDAIKQAVDGTGYHPDLSPEQLKAVKHIRARKMVSPLFEPLTVLDR